MTQDVILGWFVAVLLATNLGFFFFGKHYGAMSERARVNSLILSALHRRWSGTLRWVMHSVAEGRKALLPEEEFFDGHEHHDDDPAVRTIRTPCATGDVR